MFMENIPARTDPCWNDDAWRTAKLKEIREAHSFSISAIAELTGVSRQSASNWFSFSIRPVPANSLRMLMLELAVKSHDQ